MNAESAYWLGLFGADGCVTNGVVALSLHIKDSLHVIRYGGMVNKKCVIRERERVRDGKEFLESCAIVSFRSKEVRKTLEKYGIKKNKSKEYDPVVPEGYERHFWRGMIDGDGHIGKDSINLVGTEESCKKLKEFAKKNGVKMGDVCQGDGCKRIAAYGENAKKLKGILWKQGEVCLERKWVSDSWMSRLGKIQSERFLQKHHYLKTLPTGCVMYGWWKKNDLVGCAAVGPVSSPLLVKKGVLELKRFCVSEDMKDTCSKFLARIIKEEKKRNPATVKILTYADSAQGHYGGIYKAAGAVLESEGKAGIVFKTPDGELLSGRSDWVLRRLDAKGLDVGDCIVERSKGKNRFAFNLC